jgi:hypothetical protein
VDIGVHGILASGRGLRWPHSSHCPSMSSLGFLAQANIATPTCASPAYARGRSGGRRHDAHGVRAYHGAGACHRSV